MMLTKSQKLLALSLVYHMFGNESLQAMYSAATGSVIETLKDV